MQKAIFPIVLAFGLASAETLYVNSPTADLKDSTSAGAKVLAQLPRGAAVSVTSEQGSWVKGTAAGRSGWVYKFKLSAKKPSGGGGSTLLAGLGGGGASAREGSTAASIRGLSPTSEKYAGRAQIGPEQVQMVKRMEALRVSRADVERFLRDGKLGECGETP